MGGRIAFIRGSANGLSERWQIRYSGRRGQERPGRKKKEEKKEGNEEFTENGNQARIVRVCACVGVLK